VWSVVADLVYLSLVGAVWWGIAIGGLLTSFVAALCFPKPRSRKGITTSLPPVTAIVPVKDLHDHFEAAQTSLFTQTYPGLEILVASAEQQSSALDVVRRVQGSHTNSSSRIIWSQASVGVSPKLNNLWPAIVQAQNDLILTKDSNVVLEPHDVESFVSEFGDDVGLVSTVPVASEPQSAAAWIEASIINCYYARMLMFARALGFGFGCGKIMLFRRSDIERVGGVDCLAGVLGEDAALADAVSGLGLRTVLADRVTRQPLGLRRLDDVWNRQLRWKSIWRAQVPAIFAISLFGSALLAAAAAALAAPLLHAPPEALAVATLIGWFFIEALLCLLKGWPLSIWSPFAFLGREVLDLSVWLCALTTSEVSWAGVKYRVTKPITTAANLAPAVSQGAASNDGV
jgi:ceramide glucosyltransferase